MTVVHLGNGDAVSAGRSLGRQVTSAKIPDSYTEAEMLTVVTDLGDGLWVAHSNASAPLWVESDNEDLALVLSLYYGCPVGRPEEEGESNEG